MNIFEVVLVTDFLGHPLGRLGIDIFESIKLSPRPQAGWESNLSSGVQTFSILHQKDFLWYPLGRVGIAMSECTKRCAQAQGLLANFAYFETPCPGDFLGVP